MRLNPTAVTLWIFTTGVGYLIEPTMTGAVAGLIAGVGMSLISDIIN